MTKDIQYARGEVGENRRKHPCCLGMCPASVSLHFIPYQERLQRSAPDLRVTCITALVCLITGP